MDLLNIGGILAQIAQTTAVSFHRHGCPKYLIILGTRASGTSNVCNESFATKFTQTVKGDVSASE